jgi:phospholipid/cholesterol/gamma-HCH transport system ATP-binding protein
MMEAARQPVLKFDNVTLDFDEQRVLDSISFEVWPGQSRILLGAAGSGKTVLLKAAMGLVKPDAGAVYLFGKDLAGLRESELFDLRSRIGMVFQEGGLFDSLSIEENVAYPLVNQRVLHCPPGEVRPKVEETLSFVELEHTLDKFPSELSGGMRRRVGIARAVVTEPPLVLYDSPTAGLDPITSYTIMALILKQRDLKSTTSMIVTHRFQDGHMMANYFYNPRTAQAERAGSNGGHTHEGTVFMVLREGRLVFEGTQDELEASDDPYVSKFVRRSEH